MAGVSRQAEQRAGFVDRKKRERHRITSLLAPVTAEKPESHSFGKRMGKFGKSQQFYCETVKALTEFAGCASRTGAT
jgi:hypothetical protein